MTEHSREIRPQCLLSHFNFDQFHKVTIELWLGSLVLDSPQNGLVFHPQSWDLWVAGSIFFLIDDTLQRSSALTRNTVSHQFIHFWWKICSSHWNWHLCHCVNGEGVFSLLLLLLLLLLVSFNVDGAAATDGSGWAESIWFQCESHWRSKQLSGVFWWGHIFHLIIVSDVGLYRDHHQDRAD